jgi:hypothetical protein
MIPVGGLEGDCGGDTAQVGYQKGPVPQPQTPIARSRRPPPLTSFCSALGPLQSTVSSVPPQHALPTAMPTSPSDVLKGSMVRM